MITLRRADDRGHANHTISDIAVASVGNHTNGLYATRRLARALSARREISAASCAGALDFAHRRPSGPPVLADDYVASGIPMVAAPLPAVARIDAIKNATLAVPPSLI